MYKTIRSTLKTLLTRNCFFYSITVETITRQTGDTMQTIGTIIISQLNRTDDGLYECIAENDGEINEVLNRFY